MTPKMRLPKLAVRRETITHKVGAFEVSPDGEHTIRGREVRELRV